MNPLIINSRSAKAELHSIIDRRERGEISEGVASREAAEIIQPIAELFAMPGLAVSAFALDSQQNLRKLVDRIPDRAVRPWVKSAARDALKWLVIFICMTAATALGSWLVS